MSTRDQTKPEGVDSLRMQSWLFPPRPDSPGPNQPLHLHNQNTSNFGFPAPHLLPRSASAGVPVFALPPLPSLPQTLHRYTSVSTLQSVTRHSSADLQLCEPTKRSTRVGPLHAHHQNISPTNSRSLSTSLSALYRSVRYRTSSLERPSSRASSHLQDQCHGDSTKTVHTTTATSVEFTPRFPSRLPSRSVSDTHLWFAVGESLDHPVFPFLPGSRAVSLDKATEARERLYRRQGPPTFIDRTWSNGTRPEQTQPPASRNFSLSRNHFASYTPSPSARALSLCTLQGFPEESLQSDTSCALVQCPSRPPLSRATSLINREGFRDILSQTRTGNPLGPISAQVPVLRRSISARSHRELFFRRKQFFHQTSTSPSSCIPTKATHRPALTRSLSVGNHRELGKLISAQQEPLFVDIERRPNFDFVFPGNITQSTPLLYQSRADRSPSLASQKSPAYVPLLIVTHRGPTPNPRTMSATETAKYHGLELSAESSDAVNGGSTEEAATSLNIESTRDTRVFFVSSKRHTISPPLYLNSPVGPVEHTSRSPSSITEPRTSLFKRLKNKIFRRRSQQRNVPASPQPKAKPVVSRARQVIRRASSMNLFTARQRSQTEPASSAVLAHLPTHRARHHRHLSPLRSETPVDVESLLAFGGKIRQRSSHVSNLKADTDAEEPGPPTKSSPEQFNRRRNRMTVVAGDQTYVDGRIGQPLEWKWSGEDGDAEDGDAEDGGDGWQADGYDAPRSVVGGYPEASVQVTAQAFTQLTCPAPSREEATTSQVYEAEGQPAHSSNSLRPDSMTSGDRGEGFVEDDERDFLRLPEDSEDGQLEEQEVMGADTAVQINATSTNDHPAIVDTPITEDAPATADALAASTTDESSTAATGAGLGEVVQAQPATVGLEGSCIKLVAEASSPATTTIHTQSTPRLKMPVYRDAPFCAQNPSSSTTERENASPEFQLTSIDFDQERLATQKENQKIE